MGTIGGLRDEYVRLKSRLAETWLSESRLHALDLVDKLFADRIRDLTDAEQHVRLALAAFERGQPLPPPAAVRLAILESTGGYFRDWLVTGPILGNTLETDYLAPIGGEAGDIRPRVTEEFVRGGKTYRWKRLAAQTAAEINLALLHPEARWSTVYAYATIESPSARTVRALLGCGGSVRVLINGVETFRRSGSTQLAVDDDTLYIPLIAGTNRLLVKISGGDSGDWGFSLRLPDSGIRNRKNRYRIVSDEAMSP
ncbi:MAG TPA: hypothetical protein VLT13_08270, partial [Bacteroidota bacterium]|nr:hypothetical protein [Bacteroidota bacterium]